MIGRLLTAGFASMVVTEGVLSLAKRFDHEAFMRKLRANVTERETLRQIRRYENAVKEHEFAHARLVRARERLVITEDAMLKAIQKGIDQIMEDNS